MIMEKLLFLLGAALLSVAAASVEDECESCLYEVYQMQARVGPLRNTKLRDIVTGSSPQYICAEIGMCPENGHSVEEQEEEVYPATVDNGPVDVRMLQSGGQLCNMCRVAASFMHTMLSIKHWQDVLLRVMKIACSYLPLFKGKCSSLVDQWGEHLIKFILKYFLKPSQCHSILHICPSSTTALSEAALSADDCRMCQFGQGLVYDTVNDPDLHYRFDNFAKEICIANGDQMDIQKVEECIFATSLLSEALKGIAEELRKSTALRTFCQEENICPAGMESSPDY